MPGKRKPPLWKRLGYRTEWQYRSAKARAEGYTGEAEKRRTQSIRDTGLTPSQRRRAAKRIGPLRREEALARSTGSETKARRQANVSWMDEENREYSAAFGGTTVSPTHPRRTNTPAELQSYNQERRVKGTTFAEQARMYDADFAKTHPDYVRDYYDAFVNPDANYEHFRDLRTSGQGYYRQNGDSRAKGSFGFRQMVLRWARQLPDVQEYMTATEFQARYGSRDFA